MSANQIRAQSLYTPYAFINFVGLPGGFGTNDGTGSAARLNGPYGVVVASGGELYVSDANNCTIRKITPAGVVTTVAGRAGLSGSNDGTSSGAQFSFPSGLALDRAANLYVSDAYNHTIRKITPAGLVSTLAGSAGLSGSHDGTGSAARFYYPFGLAVDSGAGI